MVRLCSMRIIVTARDAARQPICFVLGTLQISSFNNLSAKKLQGSPSKCLVLLVVQGTKWIRSCLIERFYLSLFTLYAYPITTEG